jgi:putative transposase
VALDQVRRSASESLRRWLRGAVGISSWMTFYNFRRPHQAMNNQTPMAAWRGGMDKIEAAARAVDMPLRLDNANASPTYPQRR